MTYTIDFCVISLAFLMVTVIFYLRQMKVPSRRNSYFAALLFCCVFSLVFDIIAALFDPYAYQMPLWIVYVVNMLFLGSIQLSGLLFLLYTMTLTDAYTTMGKQQRQLACIPFSFTALALLFTPLLQENGIFYFTAEHVYQHGILHLTLYVTVAFYMFAALIVMFHHRRALSKTKFFAVMSFLFTTFIAMLVQMFHPYLLVNTMANAFALSLIYYVLEAPSNHVDTMTEIYNRAALPPLLQERKALELALLRALDNDGLQVYYQPIHNCDKKLVALEALVRLYDPEYGPLPTQEAVELAEENGNIDRLGQQVLHKVCRFIQENKAETWGLDHIGVNLSAVQCMQPSLADSILRICAQYDTPSSLLAFEITETATGSIDMLHLHMECLCAAGFFFLLDDFGKGYANISHIAYLPFHCVKIDKALLWEAMEDESKMLLLHGVAELLKGLGLKSVCEGVETAEQLALLRQYGVSMLQGYFFSKPLSPEALLAYVQAQGVRA